MKGHFAFLERWYENTKALARHRRAMPALAMVSFAESSFFPIPVDVMVIPMVQAAPEKWWKIAGVAAFFSVLGGIFGYMIGMMFYEALAQPLLEALGKTEYVERFRESINENGPLWVFGAGLTPFPYKVITIMSGAVPVPFSAFLMASILARSLRFFGVAGVVRLLGPQAEKFMKERFGLFTILLFIGLAAAWFAYKALSGH
ncbi:membrane protein YqaA with SNARE-associated domain [Litorimonas taeanensis]|uniref:Membrane protein YqaA with SNARE-associated domain n=1 Tax=Litorimonas taeanensis TaxID=568099 RepID=A0A420WE82_9PROT|nr:VTT domain-containing protein [Litorimonas taeanensis]RKQ69306.1 membrane protein YqaA with SNARE-associated domain [Litorimonas taeanensis]